MPPSKQLPINVSSFFNLLAYHQAMIRVLILSLLLFYPTSIFRNNSPISTQTSIPLPESPLNAHSSCRYVEKPRNENVIPSAISLNMFHENTS